MRFMAGSVWGPLAGLVSKSRLRRAAIAFVHSGSPIRFRAGDLLITDASDKCIRAGSTSATVIDHAVRTGVQVHSLPGLHAKVLLLDSHAVVGSANASGNSSAQIEAAVVVTDPALRTKISAWLTATAENAELIGPAFLRRILAIPVERTGGGGRNGKLSLLEAIRQQSIVLDDVVFIVTTEKSHASAARIRAAVGKKPASARFPLPGRKHLTHIEHSFRGRASQRAVEDRLGGKKVICFRGKCRADGTLSSIDELDATMTSGYNQSVRDRTALFTVLDTRTKVQVRMDEVTRKRVAKLLEKALQAKPALWTRIQNSPGEFFGPALMRKLVMLAST